MQILSIGVAILCFMVALLGIWLGIYQKLNEAALLKADPLMDTNGGFYVGALFLFLSLVNYFNWKRKRNESK